MKKITTKRMFKNDVIVKSFDNEGKVIARVTIMPYCLGCLFEKDGEEVVNSLHGKYNQTLFCPVHFERFKRLMVSRAVQN
jgi:hypothetical protein